MKYNIVTLDSFTHNQSVKIKKNNESLSIYLNKNTDTVGVIIKNVQFVKTRQYTIYINVRMPENMLLFFYSDDANVYDCNNKVYLVNGSNKIDINIGQNHVMNIGFLVENPVIGMSFEILDIEILDKVHDIDKRH